jgi:hypothetical protein
MIDPALSNLFTDPAWRKFAPQLTKEIGAYPNAIYYTANGNTSVVVSFRGVHETWALNQSGMNYVFTAVCDNRLAAGFAVLATSNPSTVVASKPIAEVHALLSGVPPRSGTFGPYWWVDEEFGTDQLRALIDAPF